MNEVNGGVKAGSVHSWKDKNLPKALLITFITQSLSGSSLQLSDVNRSVTSAGSLRGYIKLDRIRLYMQQPISVIMSY